MKISDRYLKIVEWSEEDQCYVGTCPGLMEGGVHGENEVEVYRELVQVVCEWIDLLERDGLPLPATTAGREYSGKFVIRMDQGLHKALAIDAFRHGESLNSRCIQVLRETAVPYGTDPG